MAALYFNAHASKSAAANTIQMDREHEQGYQLDDNYVRSCNLSSCSPDCASHLAELGTNSRPDTDRSNREALSWRKPLGSGVT